MNSLTALLRFLSRTLKLTPLIRTVFTLFQRLGLNITLNHYYQPIPDLASLDDDVFTRRTELRGIVLDLQKQVSLVREFGQEYGSEYRALHKTDPGVPGTYFLDNRDFGPVDAEILYGMVRKYKPSRIIEIGSGNTTLLTAQAILENRKRHDSECEFIAVEPYPREMLIKGLPGLSRFIEAPVQQVPFAEFEKLGADDILFIDSSHVLKIGGDVQYEYLEILPRLNPGVLVHIHDIFLPAEYPRTWVFDQFRFWNEQHLLQAFLSFNEKFEVVWAGSYMHLEHPGELEAAFTSYDRNENHPGSFWIRRLA